MDARRRDCDDAPAIVPLHGVGHGAEAKLPGDGSAPCLPSQSRKVYRITLKYPEARPSPGVPPRLPRWVHRNLPPLRFAAREGRSASGRVPPMDYLDNPDRRRAARPSDDASANSYGFGAASTYGCDVTLRSTRPAAARAKRTPETCMAFPSKPELRPSKTTGISRSSTLSPFSPTSSLCG